MGCKVSAGARTLGEKVYFCFMAKSGWVIGGLIGFFGLWAQDVFYGDLRFRVAPPARTLAAQVEWHFQNFQGQEMAWDLGPGLEIDTLAASVGVDTFWRDTAARKVYVRFSVPLQGEPAWIRVTYHGEPRSSGFGSYEVQKHATGWCLWTLSQPYGAPDWLFCRDGLSDKVDSLDILVSTPAELLGVANGRLIQDSIDVQGWRHRSFRHRYPIAVYLIAFAASNYVVQEFPVQTPYHTFTLRNYVFPQDTAAARQLSQQFIPYISWLEERIGPYPFASEDYQQVQIGWGGGMEHQTVTFFGRYTLELWAHELAHQWFGDWVTCGSWHDIWLNESFATYLGALAYEAVAPQWWPVWRKGAILGAWQDTLHTIWVDDTTDFRRIFLYETTYLKGALALHTLRLYVGDSLFWGALRRYLDTYARGFAKTGDFITATAPILSERIAQSFVESWIYTPHFPRLRITWIDGKSAQVESFTAYPMRVLGKVRYVSSFEEERGVDLLSLSQVQSFSEGVFAWVLDPDTLLPFWGVRQTAPLPERARVGPNPFATLLYVWAANLQRATLYDTRGQKVAEYVPWQKDGPIWWDLSFLPAGAYWLLVEQRHGDSVHLLLKVSP